MNREYHRWYSPRLEQEMELLIFGHGGAKVLAFPTRDGRFYEYENLRIIDAVRHKIEAGQLQIYCVDNVAGETFYCWWRSPYDRVSRYIQYEEYLLNEVLPLMESKNPNPCTISHGCSLGAFFAVNFALRHPHLFNKISAFSGRYDLTLNVESFDDLLDGHYDTNVYLNTPSHYLPNMPEGPQLEAIRALDIILVIGKDDPFLDNNRDLSQKLWEKGCWNALHVWDGRAHRGGYWRRMAPLYL